MQKKILVVDDDESIINSVSFVLEDKGYKVKAVIKGGEALNNAEHFKPDVVLLDVLMSGKDGREICKSLKTNEKTKNIPVIMISAHPTALKSYKETGADAFLAKPFSLEDLLSTVKKYL